VADRLARVLKGLVGGLAGLGLFLATGEGLLRWLNPTPRAQIVRDGEHMPLQERHGVPVWWSPQTERFWDLGCVERHPDAPRVMLIGDSIFRGVLVEDERNFSALVRQQAEAATGGPVCVMNVSEPGWSFQQEWAVVQDLLPKLKPDLVILEAWSNQPESYVQVGDAAYRFGPVVRGSGDRPHLFEGPIDDLLFRRSRLWEYTTLALARSQKVGEVEEVWGAFLFDRVTPLVEAVTVGGGELLVVASPPLHQPFEATLAERQAALVTEEEVGQVGNLGRAYAMFEAWTQLYGAAWIDLAVELKAEPVELVRLDECCHFNARGPPGAI
jgi:hypothetical protein